MSASQYFRNVINYAERLKIPADLTSSEKKTAQLHSLRWTVPTFESWTACKPVCVLAAVLTVKPNFLTESQGLL